MKNNIKTLFQTLFGIVALFLLSGVPSYSAPPKPFAPVGARYVVTQSDPDLTNEVLTTQLNTDIIASFSSNNIGSSLKPWGSIYGLFGLFGEVVSNVISATGANQSISINPTGTGKVLVGGDSVVVASKPSAPSSPIVGQIYFDTTLNRFRGYNGTMWVDLSQSVSSFPVESLISYWKFDESSGNALDASGNGRTATNFGSISYVAGKINNGADLESAGTNQWFAVDNSFGIFNTTSGTISLWVKPETLANSSAMVETSTGTGSDGFALDGRADGTVRWAFGDGTYSVQTSLGAISNGSWYHIVATWTPNGKKLYINAGAPVTNSNPDTLAAGQSTLFIGRISFQCNCDHFDGIIDEVGIWSRELTGAEIETLYNNGDGLPH